MVSLPDGKTHLQREGAGDGLSGSVAVVIDADETSGGIRV